MQGVFLQTLASLEENGRYFLGLPVVRDFP